MTEIAGTRDYHGAALRELTALRAAAVRSFEERGYELVEPPIIEPSSLFLERSGEEIRRRMYAFDDPSGREVCLRPELTIPACRLFLQEMSHRRESARLCYCGPVFRYEAPGQARHRQFQQAGVELLGAPDAEDADAEVVALAWRVVHDSGVGGLRLRMGDLALVRSFIEALPIGERWRERLKRHLWRLSTYRAMLRSAGGELNDGATVAGDASALREMVALVGVDGGRRVVQEILTLSGVQPAGGRDVAEIAGRLLSQASEAMDGGLSAEIGDLLEGFLAISGPPQEALARAEALASDAGIDITAAADRFRRRLERIEAAGVGLEGAGIDLGLRLGIEYYTGFLFEVHHDVPGGGAICGGGRYDGLLRLLGAPRDIPAVGFAVELERWISAIGRKRDNDSTGAAQEEQAR